MSRAAAFAGSFPGEAGPPAAAVACRMAPPVEVSGATQLTISVEALIAIVTAVATQWAGYMALRAKVADLTAKASQASTERRQLDDKADGARHAAERVGQTVDALARSGEAAGKALEDAEGRLRKLEIHFSRMKGREDAARPSRRRTRAPGEDTIG